MLNRNKRQTVAYNYDRPDLTTVDGFLKHLVVLINQDRISTLKSNRYSPDYALTLPDNRFTLGEFNINGVATYSNGATFIEKEVNMLGELVL